MPNISATFDSTDATKPVWNVKYGSARIEVSFALSAVSDASDAAKWQARIGLPSPDIHFTADGPTKAEAFAKALADFKVNGAKRGAPVIDLRAVRAELTRCGAFRAAR